MTTYPHQIEDLARKYRQELALSEDFLARKMESKFASLLFLEDVATSEPWTYKQDGRSGWIVLSPSAGDVVHTFTTVPLRSDPKKEDAGEIPGQVNNLRMAGF